MEWWQILLICLVAIVIGVGIGLGIGSLISIWLRRRKRVTNPFRRGSGYEASSKVNRGSSKPPATPVPLLSRRSIIVLSIGLIIGAMLGLGYWASIPSVNAVLDDMTSVTPSLSSTEPQTGPHESTVIVQLVNPGYSYMSLKDLQHEGEYYAAKANTFPFFEFLAQKLAEEGPQYSYTVDQLDQMVVVRYDYKAELPALEIQVTGNSDQEAMFLASSVPEVFLEFLIAEEDNLRQEEYQNTLKGIETTRTALLEAQRELADIEMEVVTEDINNNPDYLMLSATVVALQLQLGSQAADLANIIALGDTGQAYTDTLSAFQRTGQALAKAQKDLDTLEAAIGVNNLAENLDYQIAKGRVDNLSRELASLSDKLLSLSDVSVSESEVVNSLAVGDPTVPVPVPPERTRLRDALMLGAVIGLAGGWLGLNFRWLTKSLSPEPISVLKEDEENWPQLAELSEAQRRASEMSEVSTRREVMR